jgi:hypothetical protein
MPRLNSSLRAIFGRRGYFPVRTGPTAYTYKGRDWPPAPSGITEPEWRIMLAHGVLGLTEGTHWSYKFDVQNPYTVSGSSELDFLEHDLGIGILIQGEYYHYIGFDGFVQANDVVRKTELESVGVTIIAIDGEDAMKDPTFYLREARNGRDHSRATRFG